MRQSSLVYNSNYYDGINLTQMRPRVVAFKTLKTQDGTLIGLFQGNVQYYIDYYARTNPFQSVQERDNYQLETVVEVTTRYAQIEPPALDLQRLICYVCSVIEI